MSSFLKKSVVSVIALILAAAWLLPSHLLGAAQAEETEAIEVSTEEQLNAVVAGLNANGGSAAVLLTDDVTLSGSAYLTLSGGELTILGGGHTLTAAVLLSETAVMNLGQDGYGEGLTMISNRTDCGVFDVTGTATLNIYDGTVIGPTSAGGTAGGIQAHRQATVNMYGGTITDCHSTLSVSGGLYLDGNAVFNMYDGTIEKCTGLQGGAIGLSGAAPIGGSGDGTASFHMHGGTIQNCIDKYLGGGAVCVFRGSAVFTMDGGTIKDCGVSSSSYGYGGAITLYTASSVTFKMDGGKIVDNSCSDGKSKYGGALFIYCTGENDIQLNKGLISGNSALYGGGVFIFQGNLTVVDGFGLHNNAASAGGDDIYSNGANVNLGEADTSATLKNCGHRITGWYEDAESRWSYGGCTELEEHLELFEHTGEVYTEEYGLKAAHGVPTHTVTWLDDDGTVLETKTDVPEGETPEYSGPEPTREPSDGYRYVFTGWDEEVDEDTGNVTYTALYEAIPIPTEEPTAQPTAEPTATPTAESTASPTAEPTTEPTVKPTAKPTEKPSPLPPTDDKSPILVWAGLCLAALIGVCALLLCRRRRADGEQ